RMDGDGISLKTSKGKTQLNALIKNSKESLEISDVYLMSESSEKMLEASGRVMKEKGESAVRISGQRLNPQMVNDLLGWDHSWTGELEGTVKISGNLKSGLALTIMTGIRNGTVDGLEYDLFNGLITVKNDWVDLSPIEPLTLEKEGEYTVKISGKIPAPMSEEADEKMKGVPMDLHAVMKEGDLSILKFLKWIDDASGPASADLKITGTKEFPNVNGRLEITGASAKLKYLFANLANLYGNILIRDNVIDIISLKADTAGGKKGTLKIENLDPVKKGGIMKWIRPYEVNWKVTNLGDKVRFEDTPYMEFINGDAELDLAVTGLLMAPNISGTIKIHDLRYRYPVKMKNKTGEQEDPKDNYAKNINWDVKIFGGENNYFYNDDYMNTYAQVYLKFGSMPLVMKGRGNDMQITGNVGLSRGSYKYMNADFSVDSMKESKVTFDGMMKPILDVYAVTKIRRIALSAGTGGGLELPGATGGQVGKGTTVDLNVNMRAWGRVGDIKIDLSSEPYSLGRDRLLYILTFGKDSDKAISADDAVRMAANLANAWIKGQTEQLKKIAPVDVIDIKVDGLVAATPEPTGNTSMAGASGEGTVRMELGLGKFISDNMYLDYRMKLMEGQSLLDPKIVSGLSLEHTFGLEYTLDPMNKLIFEGIVRDSGYYVNPFEAAIKLQTGISFDQWGAKPTPTPGRK
ncbi:MAG TPA: translocation/assembly module TamB domain-containing protein, partial [Candidatus Goldiibacteriota bacterium]|nr:translocation/assembly module TamB domain-containing protein [Candidatus Goldiibacteriota bacterium]